MDKASQMESLIHAMDEVLADIPNSETTAPPPPYAYCLLKGPKWVRILELFPSIDHTDPLEGRITHVNCESLEADAASPMLNYDAVSYTWGDVSYSHDLIIRDSERLCVMKITAVVDSMLRWFRKPARTLYLWIDALCLNQSDVEELSEQVKVMAEIYSQAQKVRIWMGEEDEGVAKVFRYFCLINEPDQYSSDPKHKARLNAIGIFDINDFSHEARYTAKSLATADKSLEDFLS
jgi:hypothetical protein